MLVGLVGKPSSGKSTFFKALTLIDVAIANYPFTTIEPNKGVGFTRIECIDSFFKVQCNPRTGFCINHQRFVPVELMDVAGLVPGAHEGKGLGNKFLDDLRKADVLIHVVDVSGSTNEKGEQVPSNSHDPAKDILFLEEEIDLWLLGIIQKNFQKIAKQPYDSKQKMLQLMMQEISGLGVSETQVDSALTKSLLVEKKLKDWAEEDFKKFTIALRKISKPILIAANKVDLPHAEENLARLKKQFPEKIIIGCSAESELALRKAAKAGLIDYIPGDKDFKIIKELNAQQNEALELIKKKILSLENGTGIQPVLNSAVFDVLKFMAIFPGGVNNLTDSEGRVLPDCFLMPPNSTTLDFAFRLHTDFGKNFIKAIDVKTRQLKGRDALLQHRDVIEIVSKA